MGEDVHGLVTQVTCDVLRELLASGLLTTTGLSYVRGVAWQPGRLAPGEAADLLRAEADAALAEDLGCDPSLLPQPYPPGEPSPSS